MKPWRRAHARRHGFGGRLSTVAGQRRAQSRPLAIQVERALPLMDDELPVGMTRPAIVPAATRIHSGHLVSRT